MEKDLNHRQRQLYIYAAHVYEKYGLYPELLRFNLLRDKAFVDVPFCKEDYEETLQWIDSTIFSIETESAWQCAEASYFCKYLCGVNAYCSAFTTAKSHLQAR